MKDSRSQLRPGAIFEEARKVGRRWEVVSISHDTDPATVLLKDKRFDSIRRRESIERLMSFSFYFPVES